MVAAELAEQSDELENAILAAKVSFQGDELPLRAAQARLAVLAGYGERDELGAAPGGGFGLLQRPPPRPRARGRRARGGRQRRGGPGRAAARRRRAYRCASSRTCSAQASADVDETYAAMRERWFDRLLGPSATMCPPPSTWRTSGGCHRWSRRTRRSAPSRSASTRWRSWASTSRRSRNQARPRGSPAEVTPRLRNRLRPAGDRPPHHPRAGRPPRLPGLPPRGRSRASLRGLRPVAALHVPQALARPRADRDLLVHHRGHLEGTGLARTLFRALRRSRRPRTRKPRSSSKRCSFGATPRSCTSSWTSGRASPRTEARRRAMPSG